MIHELGPRAYGVAIQKEIVRLYKIHYAVGAIYVTLERLYKRRYVTKTIVDGRITYSLTAIAIQDIVEYRQEHQKAVDSCSTGSLKKRLSTLSGQPPTRKNDTGDDE
jgi:DNA-binding PadR family transcriptional regulator